jgi:Na+-translocating ferredoxin:NAD+ oxidoreductase subunit B
MLLTFTLAILAGLAAVWLADSRRTDAIEAADRRVSRIDAVLPQTQCRKCGYDGCTPYAEAIAYANESISLCPPGGEVTRRVLASMLGRDQGAAHGDGRMPPRLVARIVERDCIGCTRCIQVCPVDAIVGAGGRMHTVISNLCTGCDLCAPVCPTDCIEMHEPRNRDSRTQLTPSIAA